MTAAGADRPTRSPLPMVLAAAAALAVGVLALGANWDAWFGPKAKDKAAAGAKAGPAAKDDPFAKFAAGQAGDPAAATKLVQAYVDAARTDNNAYIDALSTAGYIRAIGGEALSQGEIGQAIERVRAGRAVGAEHRAKSMARVDALEAAIKALPARTADSAALKAEMAAEVAELRAARIDYWQALNAGTDEVERLAEVLVRSQGRWSVNVASRKVEFQDEADEADYAAHEDRSRAHRGAFEEAGERVARSAESLKGLAVRWGS